MIKSVLLVEFLGDAAEAITFFGCSNSGYTMFKLGQFYGLIRGSFLDGSIIEEWKVQGFFDLYRHLVNSPKTFCYAYGIKFILDNSKN